MPTTREQTIQRTMLVWSVLFHAFMVYLLYVRFVPTSYKPTPLGFEMQSPDTIVTFEEPDSRDQQPSTTQNPLSPVDTNDSSSIQQEPLCIVPQPENENPPIAETQLHTAPGGDALSAEESLDEPDQPITPEEHQHEDTIHDLVQPITASVRELPVHSPPRPRRKPRARTHRTARQPVTSQRLTFTDIANGFLRQTGTNISATTYADSPKRSAQSTGKHIAQDVSLARYQRKISHICCNVLNSNNHRFPHLNGTIRAQALINVHFNDQGVITALTLTQSSGYPALDTFLLDALKSGTFSFPPLPPSLRGKPFVFPLWCTMQSVNGAIGRWSVVWQD